MKIEISLFVIPMDQDHVFDQKGSYKKPTLLHPNKSYQVSPALVMDPYLSPHLVFVLSFFVFYQKTKRTRCGACSPRVCFKFLILSLGFWLESIPDLLTPSAVALGIDGNLIVIDGDCVKILDRSKGNVIKRANQKIIPLKED